MVLVICTDLDNIQGLFASFSHRLGGTLELYLLIQIFEKYLGKRKCPDSWMIYKLF